MKKIQIVVAILATSMLLSCQKKQTPVVEADEAVEETNSEEKKTETLPPKAVKKPNNEAHKTAFAAYIEPIYGMVDPLSIRSIELPEIQQWLKASAYEELAKHYSTVEVRVRGFATKSPKGEDILFAEVPEKLRIEDIVKEEFILLHKTENKEGEGKGGNPAIADCELIRCSVINKNNYNCIKASTPCPAPKPGCTSPEDCKPKGGDEGEGGDAGSGDDNVKKFDLFGF